MRGLFFAGAARLRRDLPEPDPLPGEALLRVRLAGVCRTDIEILRGYVPFRGVLGHEFVANVERAPGREDLVGRRVVGEINAACGACRVCLTGPEGRRHCPARTVLGIAGRDGCLAERCLLPVHNLLPVPDEMPDETAIFVEPVAAALRIAEQVRLDSSTSMLVMGDGKLGLLTAMALAPRVGRLVLAGRHDTKLAIAREAGIEAVTETALGSETFDVVVDATGRPEGAARALGRARPLGTLVMKSTIAGDTTLPLSAAVVNEVTIIGSRCGPFGPAFEALASGALDTAPLVDSVYPLEDAERALERASAPGALKVLVDCLDLQPAPAATIPAPPAAHPA